MFLFTNVMITEKEYLTAVFSCNEFTLYSDLVLLRFHLCVLVVSWMMNVKYHSTKCVPVWNNQRYNNSHIFTHLYVEWAQVLLTCTQLYTLSNALFTFKFYLLRVLFHIAVNHCYFFLLYVCVMVLRSLIS